jgi:hypothetical protein
MRVSCFCNRRRLNPENATIVVNGIPLCLASSCERAALRTQRPELHREADYLRRREEAAREVV